MEERLTGWKHVLQLEVDLALAPYVPASFGDRPVGFSRQTGLESAKLERLIKLWPSRSRTASLFAMMHASKNNNNKIGHHAKPKRASATAPLRTGADMCKGVGAGSSAGADK